MVFNLLLELFKKYKLYFFIISIIIILDAIDQTLKPYLIKLVIDHVQLAKFSHAWQYIIIFSIYNILMALSNLCYDRFAIKYYYQAKIHLKKQYFSKLYKYSKSFFQKNFTGSIVSKIAELASASMDLILSIFFDFINFFITIVISLYLFYEISLKLAIFSLSFSIIYIVVTYYMAAPIKKLAKRASEASAQLSGVIADYLSNIITVKYFANISHEEKIFDRSAQKFYNYSLKRNRFFAIFYLKQNIITTIYFFICIGYLLILCENSSITAGDFTLIYMLNSNLITRIYHFSNIIKSAMNNWATIDQALSLLKNPPEIGDIANAKELIITNGQIDFKNVQFSYKNNKPLFIDKNISIAGKQKIGLVGLSGAGKSSFVNLILRMFEVNNGEILIDNQNIKYVTQDSLRKNIAFIPQEPVLFNRSLYENISYGNVTAAKSEIIAAAKLAHADEFIRKLPDGYNSIAGERGVKLSGGERQRIAIARAILKNAPILILDEASSALDSITEQKIQQAMHNLMQNKTVIVIAHRLSTLLNMDEILVLDKGRVIEQGRHLELLNKNGFYKKLWQAQDKDLVPK